MGSFRANTTSIIRASQKDDQYIDELDRLLTRILQIEGRGGYRSRKKIISIVSVALYYLSTSLSNLQTLGEEYTGLIRYDTGRRKIPARMVQLLWLILYIGGDTLFVKTLVNIKNNISESTFLTEEAKHFFTNILTALQENKHLLNKLHTAVFYTNSKYYNVSNRLTGIQYVFVRPWLQDERFDNAFSLLGKTSMFYLLFRGIYNFYESFTKPKESAAVEAPSGSRRSRRDCYLCFERRKCPSALPCGHIYCWRCIQESLRYDQRCPVCRFGAQPHRVVLLQNY